MRVRRRDGRSGLIAPAELCRDGDPEAMVIFPIVVPGGRRAFHRRLGGPCAIDLAERRRGFLRARQIPETVPVEGGFKHWVFVNCGGRHSENSRRLSSILRGRMLDKQVTSHA